ncbi:FtsX-like permease family protein [Trebonia sp.]|uniref:FtsX-like permease family protein n=1 Tax=Trebonia sp. TaxID=2767075 RepID=UPI00345BF3FF
MGTLTLALIERIREVGILRCLGAGARQIRRVFSTEAVVIGDGGVGPGLTSRISPLPGACSVRRR